MAGVPVGVEKDNGDSLDVRSLEQLDDALCTGAVDRKDDVARGVDPLVDLEPELARDKWAGILEKRVVQLVAPVAPDLEDVPKSPCRDERRRRESTLDDRVGRKGCAMQEEAQIRLPDADLVAKRCQPGDESCCGIATR